MPNEHDDDLDPEVREGAEIEIEAYQDPEDQEDGQPAIDATNPRGRTDDDTTSADLDDREAEDESSDTI